MAEGDVIELIGKRSTPARAVGPSRDEGLSIIRLDGLQRANAEIGSGDFIEIRKADAKAAQRVVFAPAQKNLRLHGSAQALKRSFGMKPLTAGDVVATTGQQQIMRGDIPPELRKMLTAPAFALQEIRLTVVAAVPKGIVLIDANTEIELRPEFTEAKESRRADVTYDDIGGIGTTIDQLREMVELPLRYPEIFERLGVDPPRASCSMVRRAPARPGWRKRLPMRARPVSSILPARKSWVRLMARAKRSSANCSTKPPSRRRRSFSSTR